MNNAECPILNIECLSMEKGSVSCLDPLSVAKSRLRDRSEAISPHAGPLRLRSVHLHESSPSAIAHQASSQGEGAGVLPLGQAFKAFTPSRENVVLKLLLVGWSCGQRPNPVSRDASGNRFGEDVLEVESLL